MASWPQSGPWTWVWFSCIVQVGAIVDSFASGVVDGVDHDVVDVIVGDRIDDLAAALLASDQVGSTQDPQVLGHERLGGADRLDELMDAAGAIQERHQH